MRCRCGAVNSSNQVPGFMPDYISRALGTNGASGNARSRQFEIPNRQADVQVELYPGSLSSFRMFAITF